MRKISKKRQEQNKQYKEKRDEFMRKNPFCKCCGGMATEVHHMNGRTG